MLQCVMARIDPPTWSMSTTNRVSGVPLEVCQVSLYVGAALPLRFLIKHRYQLIAALPPLENSQVCVCSVSCTCMSITFCSVLSTVVMKRWCLRSRISRFKLGVKCK